MLHTQAQKRKERITMPNTKEKLKRVLRTIISILVTFCGITGITLYTLLPGKDWQKIAEEYNNQGLELYNSGAYREAIEFYDKAIELEDKGIANIDICYYNRGKSYYKLGDYEKAVGDYTQAIAIASRLKYYFERANAYEALGDYEHAALDNANGLLNTIE